MEVQTSNIEDQNTKSTGQKSKKIYPWRAIASFLLVLFTMPLGHAIMILMEKFMDPTAVHYAGFTMGFVGLVMVIIGVFVKGDTRQTLWGLIGGLLFWTGWVEFLFLYYARRYGVPPEIENGQVVTKPEYLIMPASFGMWMMVMTMYIFSTKNGCDFITWIQKKCFGKRKQQIVFQPMTRHTSIVTFMELNMMLWALYLLLMFCYDKNFLGDHHPVTYLVGVSCLVGSLFIFKRQLFLASWGANIRMAIATVIIFWTPVEILGRINFFHEFWVEPEKYMFLMVCILLAFIFLLLYFWLKASKRRKFKRQ
jgi:putative membrane protein